MLWQGKPEEEKKSLFPFGELGSVSSWNSGSTIAGGLPNPGTATYPYMLWEAVVHCQDIKLDSLMSSELLVRSSSPRKLNLQGSAAKWAGLVWFPDHAQGKEQARSVPEE